MIHTLVYEHRHDSITDITQTTNIQSIFLMHYRYKTMIYLEKSNCVSKSCVMCASHAHAYTFICPHNRIGKCCSICNASINYNSSLSLVYLCLLFQWQVVFLALSLPSSIYRFRTAILVIAAFLSFFNFVSSEVLHQHLCNIKYRSSRDSIHQPSFYINSTHNKVFLKIQLGVCSLNRTT